mmetsp:Transcript_24053/g.55820  ORF Transcript_24053/g.55820 Transcript_24053/m.55820 type:complete len:200 (+) Transcript_24053:1476-2075(+)
MRECSRHSTCSHAPFSRFQNGYGIVTSEVHYVNDPRLITFVNVRWTPPYVCIWGRTAVVCKRCINVVYWVRVAATEDTREPCKPPGQARRLRLRSTRQSIQPSCEHTCVSAWATRPRTVRASAPTVMRCVSLSQLLLSTMRPPCLARPSPHRTQPGQYGMLLDRRVSGPSCVPLWSSSSEGRSPRWLLERLVPFNIRLI